MKFPSAKVINIHSIIQRRQYIGALSYIYIGRGTIFGNPFYIIKGQCTREQVIAKFREYAPRNVELMRRLPELRDRVLGCSCKPLPCHGDVLVEFLDKYTDKQLQRWTVEPTP